MKALATAEFSWADKSGCGCQWSARRVIINYYNRSKQYPAWRNFKVSKCSKHESKEPLK